MKISVAKLAAALQDEGFSQDQILNFIAISRGESDFDVSGVNRGVEGGDEGDDSWGLFQINFAKGAAGDLRADALKIPTKADGLPTVAGLAKYFGLVRTKNKDGSKKTHSYKIKQGVSEEEVIAKNVAALKMMWNKEDYSAWSVHPDSPKFAGSQDAQDKWNGAATGRFANRQGNADFAEEFFKNEYGETVEFSDSDSLLGETEQPDNSANVGVFTPESSSEEDRTGPSMRELELEEEFEANRIAGNRDRQQEILEEIMEERERYTAERSGTLTPQQTESRSFNRDRFPDGSAVDFDLPPHLLESSTRLPNVLTQEMVDSLYQMYGGADYFMGREDMRIFTGLDGKPIKPTVVDGYTIEPGMNALLYAQVMGYEVRAHC